MRLRRISEIENGELPIAKATFYKWACLGKNPELFIRLSGRALYLDLDRFESWLERHRLSKEEPQCAG